MSHNDFKHWQNFKVSKVSYKEILLVNFFNSASILCVKRPWCMWGAVKKMGEGGTVVRQTSLGAHLPPPTNTPQIPLNISELPGFWTKSYLNTHTLSLLLGSLTWISCSKEFAKLIRRENDKTLWIWLTLVENENSSASLRVWVVGGER